MHDSVNQQQGFRFQAQGAGSPTTGPQCSAMSEDDVSPGLRQGLGLRVSGLAVEERKAQGLQSLGFEAWVLNSADIRRHSVCSRTQCLLSRLSFESSSTRERIQFSRSGGKGQTGNQSRIASTLLLLKVPAFARVLDTV